MANSGVRSSLRPVWMNRGGKDALYVQGSEADAGFWPWRQMALVIYFFLFVNVGRKYL